MAAIRRAAAPAARASRAAVGASMPDGEGTVVEANVVSGMLKVRSHVESLAPKFYHRTECTYLRGGRRAPAKPRPEE